MFMYTFFIWQFHRLLTCLMMVVCILSIAIVPKKSAYYWIDYKGIEFIHKITKFTETVAIPILICAEMFTNRNIFLRQRHLMGSHRIVAHTTSPFFIFKNIQKNIFTPNLSIYLLSISAYTFAAFPVWTAIVNWFNSIDLCNLHNFGVTFVVYWCHCN